MAVLIWVFEKFCLVFSINSLLIAVVKIVKIKTENQINLEQGVSLIQVLAAVRQSTQSMKSKLIILLSFVLASCGRLKTFVLKDPGNDKYYLSDSIKIAYKKGYVEKSPLIAIDGVPFDYQKNLDTVILPLQKNQITSIDFLNKKSSPAIYGANADNGAVIINTIALPKYTSDTIQTERATKEQ